MWQSTHVLFHLVKNEPERQYGWDNWPFNTIFGSFWGLFNASVTSEFKMCFTYQNYHSNLTVERATQERVSRVLFIPSNHLFSSTKSGMYENPLMYTYYDSQYFFLKLLIIFNFTGMNRWPTYIKWPPQVKKIMLCGSSSARTKQLEDLMISWFSPYLCIL